MMWTWFVVAVLAAGAVFAEKVKAQAPTASAKPAAVVNGTSISMAEVDAIFKAQGPPPADLTDAKRRQTQMFILGNFIDDALLQQFLTKNGLKVDAAEVNKQVAELEEGLKKQGKTLA